MWDKDERGSETSSSAGAPGRRSPADQSLGLEGHWSIKEARCEWIEKGKGGRDSRFMWKRLDRGIGMGEIN